MSIIEIKPGDEASAEVLNGNFKYLDEAITASFATLENRVNSTTGNISNISSNLSTIQGNISTTNSNLEEVSNNKASKDLSDVSDEARQLFMHLSFPNWSARENRNANTQYMAESDGYVYIATNEGDGKSYSNWNIEISKDGSSWLSFPVKTIAPGTGRDNKCVMFPIPKGYYYKTPSRSFVCFYFIPAIGG